MKKGVRRTASVLLLAAALGGCAHLVPQSTALRAQWPDDLPQRVELESVPFFAQTEYQCGPASLAEVLNYSGVTVTPAALVDQVYIPARRGTVQVEMLAAPRRYGLVSYRLAPRYDDLLREIAAGTPVVVLQDNGIWPVRVWHYAVAVGFDAERGHILLRSGERERLSLPIPTFEYTWKAGGNWAMVAVPPEKLPATADRAAFLRSIVALEHAGQAAAAAKAYAAFLARWPGDTGAGIGLANAHYALRDFAAAERALRQVLAQEPGSVIALNNLAQVLADQGRTEEALQVIDVAAAGAGPYAAAVGETRADILRRMDGAPRDGRPGPAVRMR